MKYAFFDESGRIVSAHDDATVSSVPKGAEGLTDEQWADRCNLRLIEGEIKVVEPEASYEAAAFLARRERTRRLAADVDSINPLRWEGMSENEKTKLHEYRQALLDITKQKGFPFNIEWPSKD